MKTKDIKFKVGFWMSCGMLSLKLYLIKNIIIIKKKNKLRYSLSDIVSSYTRNGNKYSGLK